MSWLARLKPQPASLSSKVLWCIVVTILVIELLALVPVLGRQRVHWMYEVKARADIAAFALQSAPPAAVEDLLRLGGIERLTLISPQGSRRSWQIKDFSPGTRPVVIPAQEHIGQSSLSICQRIAGYAPAEMALVFPSPLSPRQLMMVDVDTSPLTYRLRLYARRGLSLIVIVSLLSGLTAYAVLNWLLVRPMEILTASIIRFREAPEEAETSGLDWLAARPKDDISTAARELRTMQEELRAALWRNARLAAVGTAVAKIAHDLRNILSSALLVADRLHDVDDPVVRRATRSLIPSVEHAAQLVTNTVNFAREGRTLVSRSPVRLKALVDEVAETLAPENTSWNVENLVPDELELPLDRGHLHRVLANLVRNAAEAGATLISLSTENRNGQIRLRVADNGPGLPERAKANLFKPFTGSVRSGGTGLGLAIARDLIRAHGGDLVLERTGADGTVFCMDLTTDELQGVNPAPTRAYVT